MLLSVSRALARLEDLIEKHPRIKAGGRLE